MVLFSAYLAATERRAGRPVIPGCKSDVSNVSMIKPKHSAIANVDRNPTMAAKKQGIAMDIGGPFDVSVLASAANGSKTVNIMRRSI